MWRNGYGWWTSQQTIETFTAIFGWGLHMYDTSPLLTEFKKNSPLFLKILIWKVAGIYYGCMIFCCVIVLCYFFMVTEHISKISQFFLFGCCFFWEKSKFQYCYIIYCHGNLWKNGDIHEKIYMQLWYNLLTNH